MRNRYYPIFMRFGMFAPLIYIDYIFFPVKIGRCLRSAVLPPAVTAVGGKILNKFIINFLFI